MQSQQPDNQKNLLLAIVLSVGVLLAWHMFYAGPKLKDEQERQKRQQQTTTSQQAPSAPGQSVSGQSAPGQTVTPGGQAPVAPGAAPAAAIPITREAALKAAPRIELDTPTLQGSVSLKGGRLDDLSLKGYRETVEPRSPNVVLFHPADAERPYFAESGWATAAGSAARLPDRDTLWTAESKGPLTPASPVTLSWDNGQGLKFRRTFSIDDNYLFKITDVVENTGSGEATLYPYARIYRYGTPVIQGFFILHEGLIGVAGDVGLQELAYSDMIKDGGGKTFDKLTGGWLGFTDKYWAAALIPPQTETYRASFSGQKRAGPQLESYQTDYLLNAVAVPAGATRTVETQLFAGAKRVGIIEAYGERLGIKKFDLMVDWGWFYFITKPLFYLIDWLSRILGNFGLAILAVTVLVKAAFFPLANKSYESMAKMKKLQPEMERLRDRYKDDRARQQQELMALYQKEKINPLAGCLPILIQIPVFFALYKVLFVTIDMRHAPFFGWIRDLSAPDPTSIFNLFGLLPYVVPEWLLIGVWPLIMGATMWFQMQLNPQQPDPVQQQIFNWMPVLFTFLLASFPAGLVIYWAWNNVLSIAQQAIIMKRQGVEIPVWKNLGLDKWLGVGGSGKS